MIFEYRCLEVRVEVCVGNRNLGNVVKGWYLKLLNGMNLIME